MGNFISNQEEEEDFYYDIISHWNHLQPKLENHELFDLTELSQEVVWKILDKIDYTDYAVLEETSRSLAIACNARKFRRPFLVPTIYINKKTVKLSPDYYESCHPRIPWHAAVSDAVRIKADTVNITYRANSGRIQAVSKLFEENKTSAKALNLHEHILFGPADLDRLIKSLRISHLDCRQFLPKEFFQSSVLQNLNTMTLNSSGCTDDEVVKLKMDYMYMTNDFITARGLNRFLKQWKKQEREICVVDIEFDSSWGTRDFEVILEGLEVNPIWTPTDHSNSLISCIPLEEYHPMKTGDPEHLYSMCRSDNIGKIQLIRLRQSRFEVFYTHCESAFLLSYLDDDQYYTVTGRCMYCETEFCAHRRRFSTQRLKNASPNFYKKMISGVVYFGNIFALARTSQLLLGAPSVPVQPIDQYHYDRYIQEHRPESKLDRLLLDIQLVFFNC